MYIITTAQFVTYTISHDKDFPSDIALINVNILILQ